MTLFVFLESAVVGVVLVVLTSVIQLLPVRQILYDITRHSPGTRCSFPFDRERDDVVCNLAGACGVRHFAHSICRRKTGECDLSAFMFNPLIYVHPHPQGPRYEPLQWYCILSLLRVSRRPTDRYVCGHRQREIEPCPNDTISMLLTLSITYRLDTAMEPDLQRDTTPALSRSRKGECNPSSQRYRRSLLSGSGDSLPRTALENQR